MNTDFLIQIIQNDNINGSMTIARNTISVVLKAFQLLKYKKEPFIEFINRLKKAKPEMAAVQNTIEFAKNDILNKITHFDTTHHNEDLLLSLRKDMLSYLENETQSALQTAHTFIKNNYSSPLNIITCSFSSTVLNLCRQLSEEYSLVVDVLSFSNNQINYGLVCYNELKKLNIETNLVEPSNLLIANYPYSFAIIGSDSIIKFQGVVNGEPSLFFTEYCKELIPVYVIAEKIKETNSYIQKEHFDFIPQNSIRKIFS